MNEKKIKPIRIDDLATNRSPGAADESGERFAWTQASSAEAYESLRFAEGDDPAALKAWPESLLRQHRESRRTSDLGRILRTAREVRDGVDRVVFLGKSEAIQPAIDLLIACREPHFNEWTRAERGGRPRINFLTTATDNDLAAMTASLLARERSSEAFAARWAIVGLAPNRRDESFDALWNLFTCELRPDAVIMVRDDGLALPPLLPKSGVELQIDTPRYLIDSPLSDYSLLAGSMMGIDVVRMLEGASAMQRRFDEEPPPINAALRLARWLSAVKTLNRDDGELRLVAWSHALAEMKWWRKQVGSVFGKGRLALDAFPDCTTIGAGSALSIAIDGWRCDATADLPLHAHERLESWLQARRRLAPATLDIRLPAVDESSLGQLFQLMLLCGELVRALGGKA